MSLPSSLKAYTDCQQLYEAAAADPKGARACLGTYDACVNMRTRMHYYRKLDREANALIYPDRAHPMHNSSAYDEYVIQILKDEDGEFWLYVQPRSAKILAIEGLSGVDDPSNEITDVESHEVHLIEDGTNG